MKHIGSYVELELEKNKELFADISEGNKIRLNTCRAAICHAVRCYGVKKVWIAKYQCDVVRDFLIREGLEVFYYDIDEMFNPLLEENPRDSAIVLTNYFGILGDKHFNPLIGKYNNVIIDNAQALFYHPKDNCLNCYSPRKFVGAPDGAYVIGKDANKFSYPKDRSSDTSQFLLMRYEYGCEGEGYANKKNNDRRIDESPILLMSDLTKALLDSFDYNRIIKIRQENFRYSRALFDGINQLDIANLTDDTVTPMGYPLWNETIEIIPQFHKNKIYQARFWEYLITDGNEQSIEYRLARYLALICTDQRYGKEEIDFQNDIIQAILS